MLLSKPELKSNQIGTLSSILNSKGFHFLSNFNKIIEWNKLSLQECSLKFKFVHALSFHRMKCKWSRFGCSTVYKFDTPQFSITSVGAETICERNVNILFSSSGKCEQRYQWWQPMPYTLTKVLFFRTLPTPTYAYRIPHATHKSMNEKLTKCHPLLTSKSFCMKMKSNKISKLFKSILFSSEDWLYAKERMNINL